MASSVYHVYTCKGFIFLSQIHACLALSLLCDSLIYSLPPDTCPLADTLVHYLFEVNATASLYRVPVLSPNRTSSFAVDLLQKERDPTMSPLPFVVITGRNVTKALLEAVSVVATCSATRKAKL